MIQPSSFYAEKITQYEIAGMGMKRKISLYAILRFIGFGSLLLSLYFYFRMHEPVFLAYGIGFLLVFFWLIRISLDLREKNQLNEKLLFINHNEAGVAENRLSRFDNGGAFGQGASYTEDLDIFGEGSLYHLLNRTTTSHGSAQLSALLKDPFLTTALIRAYQEAIKTLSPQADKRQLLTAHGLLGREENGNLHSLTEWLNTPGRLDRLVWLRVARIALPVFNLAGLWYFLYSDRLFPLLAGIAASSLLTVFFMKYINRQHKRVSKKQEILNQYASIIEVFSTVGTGASEKLTQLSQTIRNAKEAIRALSRLTSFLDQRGNLLVASLFNMFFLYDLQCLFSLEKWKGRFRTDFPQWIAAIAEIETLNSLSTYAFNNPGYAYPFLREGKPGMEAAQMAHPLIPEKERTPNDFSIGKDNRLQVITGSNMSGKTTFLRTVGINLLLARCGAPVCAAHFSITPMAILTSIRINDSLREHTSYFMAELNRLAKLVRTLETGKPALALVDEILRGTNSEDKTYGSAQFIRRLLRHNCVALFATHDLSLGTLEKEYPGVVSNYCFESVIRDNELFFDYKLKSGIAKNRNASFLMNRMDII